MTQPDEFDQFYKDVRTRLLLLTYCLTGDLPSSRAAVRDAFVVAWHHWRKVSRLHDPEAWVRSHACRHAQRRHTAKLWHREKGLDPEVHATLDALGRLSLTQRRVLLLTELTSASLAEMAREVGLTRADAERELQLATSQFALHREVSTTQVRAMLEAVLGHVESVSWPRSTILRRAGATRRRTHTVIGIASIAAALVVSGTLVSGADGVRPTLSDERVEAGSGPKAAVGPTDLEVPDDAMLNSEVVAAQLPGSGWHTVDTTDNSAGDGLVMTCQTEPYADPRPDDAVVRTLRADAAGKRNAAAVVQATVSSRNERRARRAYATALGWFAGCRDDRAQLLATYALPSLGDQAQLVQLRTWKDPQHTLLAGVARTGNYTTATVSTVPARLKIRPAVAASLLSSSVNSLCELPEGGSCASGTRPTAAAPVPVGQVPAMLSEVDLPAIRAVARPWAGTEPRRALANAAATYCDNTAFKGAGVTNNLTRTFLIPDAKLPREFGLTETVGTTSVRRAKAMLDQARARMKACPDKQMGTKVTTVRDVHRGNRELAVWRVSTEVTDDRTLDFLMGLVRDGRTVAQVGFVPGKGVTIGQDDFLRLVARARDRLAAMPAPRR